MCHREPVPELSKKRQSDDSRHGHISIPSHQAYRDVSSACIDEALRQARPEFRHGIFVLVTYDLFKQFASVACFRVESRVLLDQNHGQSNAGSLPHEIGRVFCERLKDLNCFWETRAGA